MEEFMGAEFEDSLFEERRERPRPGPAPTYTAKACEPQWFCEKITSKDDVEILTVKKFRGDLAYRKQEFQRQEATNSDHLTTVLYLQLAIYQSLGALEKSILALQQLVSLHPFNPWNWKKLAEVYLRLGPAKSSPSSPPLNGFPSADPTFRAPLTSSGRDAPSRSLESQNRPDRPRTRFSPGVESGKAAASCHGQEMEEGLTGFPGLLAGGNQLDSTVKIRVPEGSTEIRVNACSSFVRSRLLFQLIESQQTSFALEKNLKAQEEIEEQVKAFGFEEETLLLISEVMGEDIIPEKVKDEGHAEVKCVGSAALDALVIASVKEFEDRWFRKIEEHIRTFENRGH
ncbi:uncharacterized protein C8orf76 homolog isoform X2 [Tachyglossus aculeatus]|uniref:uncharacterized protein C8orf76 homolog isoform X2 n=1 Tax=Tachyglossus aculeatus TaxID=9261 RepID=UPI0018F4E671|nr:uncharacterized protein C8orf76 homolog isoform X2 [Tachyglossus aculeatus]